MFSSSPSKPPGLIDVVQSGGEAPSLDPRNSPQNSFHDLNDSGRSRNHHQPHASSGSPSTHPKASKSHVHGSEIGSSDPAASDNEAPGHAQMQQVSQLSSGSASITSAPTSVSTPDTAVNSTAATLAALSPAAPIPATNSIPSTGSSIPAAPNPAAKSIASTATLTPAAQNLAAGSSASTANSAQIAQATTSVPTLPIAASASTAPILAGNSTAFTGTLVPITLNLVAHPTGTNSAQSQAQGAAIPSSSSAAEGGGDIPDFQCGNQDGFIFSEADRYYAIQLEIQKYNAWRSLPAQQQPRLQVRRAFTRHIKHLSAELAEIQRRRLPERRPDWALPTRELSDLIPDFGFWRQVGAGPKYLVPVHPENWLFPYYRVLPQEIQGLATWAAVVRADDGVGGIWKKLLIECPYKSGDELGQWRQRLKICLQRLIAEVAADSCGNLDLESQNLSSSSGSSSRGEANEDEEVYVIEEQEGYYGVDWENESEKQEFRGNDDLEESQPSASPGVSVNSEINSVGHASGIEESLAERQEGQKSIAYEGEEGKTVEKQLGEDYEEAVEVIATALFRGDRNRATAYLTSGGWEEQMHRFQKRPSATRIRTPRNKRPRANSHTEDFGAGPSVSARKKSKYHDKSTLPAARESSHRSSSPTSFPSTMRDQIEASPKRKRSSELEDPNDQRSLKKGKGKVGAGAHSPGKARDFSSKTSHGARAKLLEEATSHPLASSSTPSRASQTRMPIPADQSRTGTTPNSQPRWGGKTRLPAQASHHIPAVAAQNDDDEKFEGSAWCIKEGRALYNLVKARREFEQERKLNPLKDVSFWSLISDQLAKQNIFRSGSACKNFWGRTGRGYFNYEERINPRNPGQLVTSAQLSKKEKQAKKAEEAKREARQRGSARFENKVQEQFLEDGEEHGQYEEEQEEEEELYKE